MLNQTTDDYHEYTRRTVERIVAYLLLVKEIE